jgi:hypothetical protein
MAPETVTAPTEAELAPPRPRRRREPTAGSFKTSEQAREAGKKGGRPKGSITKAKLQMFDLAKTILTDPTVQQKMLAQAQAGELHPSVIRELLYIYNGRPTYKMEPVREKDPDEAEKRERMRAMPKEKRRMMLDLIREANQLALPEARIVSSSPG